MALRRGPRRSIVGTAGRTALITGTAVATSNAVNGRAGRRQAEAQAAADAAAAQQVTQAQPAAPGQAQFTAAQITDDVIAQLERLSALHKTAQLTDDEFNLLKARALGGGI